MGNSVNSSGNYRIEISGWGLDNNFFVEQTDLFWDRSGEKQVLLHHALPREPSFLFGLLASEPSTGTVPVAYQVCSCAPMDCNGQCEMRLTQLHPRSKESHAGEVASYVSRGLQEEYANRRKARRSWNTRRSSNENRNDDQSTTQDRLGHLGGNSPRDVFHSRSRAGALLHQGNYCEMDSDLGGIIRYPAEEFEFFAYLSEMDDSDRELTSPRSRRQFAFGTVVAAILSKLERDSVVPKRSSSVN